MRKTYLSTIAACLLAGSATADEITDQVTLGVEAYEAQEYQAAIDELQYAVALIQELLNAQNAQLLPDPLSGWEAGEVENTSAALGMLGGGGTHMSRRYSKGDMSVEIVLSANSPLLATMSAMISNPMLLNSDPNTSAYRFKRMKGYKNEGDTNTEITLLVTGQIMLQVKGRYLEDDTPLTDYLNVLDFDRIKQSLTQ